MMTVGLDEIDLELTNAAAKKHTSEDLNILQQVQNGSFWTAEGDYITCKTQTKRCLLCRCEDETTDHFRKCEVLDQCRRELDSELADIYLEVLPIPLRHGVVPAMAADQRFSFWSPEAGCSSRETGGVPRSQRGQQGQHFRISRSGQPMNDEEAKLCGYDAVDVTKMYLDSEIASYDETDTARKAMQKRWSLPHAKNHPLPDKCHQEPPAAPSVYTDGALANPASRFGRCGGFGIFYLSSGGAEHRAGKESDYTREQPCEGGVMKWALFNGGGNSSSWCELAGLIMGLQAPGAVHIATDSNAAYFRTKRMLKHHKDRQQIDFINADGSKRLGGEVSRLHFEKTWRRNIDLTNNGDLWNHINEAMVRKGADTIEIKKVRAHTSREMIEQGTIDEPDRDGNGRADEAANKGSRDAQQQTRDLADPYSSRHSRYRKLVERIHAFIIGVVKERARMKEVQEKMRSPFRKKGAVEKVQIPEAISFEEGHQSQKLSMRNLTTQDRLNFADFNELKKVRNYLAKLDFNLRASGGPGITWVELYCHYRIHAEPEKPTACWETGVMHQKKNMLARIGRFKKAVGYLNKNVIDEDQSIYLQAASGPTNRLMTFAVKNKHAAVRGQPQIDYVDKQLIAKAFVRMKGITDNKRMEALEKGRLMLKPVALRLRLWPIRLWLASKAKEWTWAKMSRKSMWQRRSSDTFIVLIVLRGRRWEA